METQQKEATRRLSEAYKSLMAGACQPKSASLSARHSGSTCRKVLRRYRRLTRTRVLLQQLNQTSKTTSLLDSILGCLVYTLQQDTATSKIIQQDFWANRGEVSVTDAVSFILAGQADSAAIGDSLTDYLKLLSLLGQYNTPEQQLQLLRLSQGVLKQAAQLMRDSAAFQVQFMHITKQLLQIDTAYQGDASEIVQGSKLLRVGAHALKTHSQVAEVFDSAVMLLDMLLTHYESSSCFDALVEEVLDSNLALEVEIAVKALQAQPESTMAEQVEHLATAIAAGHQLQQWRAVHRENMSTDVLQAMEEASDDESVLAEGSQVNVTANAGSFSLALTDRYCSSPTKERNISQQQEELPKVEKQSGLVSFLKGALKRLS
ncbi:hypothetical protein ABBQ38_011608 [Trebouxia sp. C0009 RCD-2024]